MKKFKENIQIMEKFIEQQNGAQNIDIYSLNFSYDDLLTVVKIVSTIDKKIIKDLGLDGATDEAIRLMMIFQNSTYDCLELFMKEIGEKLLENVI